MHDSRTIANAFLERAAAADRSLTPMQLLKLVYIAHGWMLGLHGRPLIEDEVEAWQYGPVIRSLYDAIRQFKSFPVQGPIDLGGDAAGAEASLDQKETSVIDEVFEGYGRLSGPALSRITHKAGSPWALTYEPGSFGKVISNDLIQDHYARLAEEAHAA